MPSDESGDVEPGALDVLTSGPLPPDPGEFVGYETLAEILTSLRAAYDLVIVDTPPLLAVGDAMTLSAKADGILVVTRLNVVSRPMLGELKRQLETAPAPKLGLRGDGLGGRRRSRLRIRLPLRRYAYGDPAKADRARAVKEAAEPNPAVTVEEADRALSGVREIVPPAVPPTVAPTVPRRRTRSRASSTIARGRCSRSAGPARDTHAAGSSGARSRLPTWWESCSRSR